MVARVDRRVVVVDLGVVAVAMSMRAAVMVPMAMSMAVAVAVTTMAVAMTLVTVVAVSIFVVVVISVAVGEMPVPVLACILRVHLPPGVPFLLDGIPIEMLGCFQKLLRNVEAVLQGELAHLLRGRGGSRCGVHGAGFAESKARTKVGISLARAEHLQSSLFSH